MWLGRSWREGDGCLRFALGGGEVRNVIERNGEVDMPKRQLRVELQGVTESLRCFLVFELFEESNTKIVGAVSLLPSVRRGGLFQPAGGGFDDELRNQQQGDDDPKT